MPNPKYADLLINIVEKYNLTTFDKNRLIYLLKIHILLIYGLPYLMVLHL